ncbi:hypothetical protein M758_UG207800 [Ceratodon purpureus]|nr:hypothetical protein M758_UG207800 [Ceratodon purpureus]
MLFSESQFQLIDPAASATAIDCDPYPTLSKPHKCAQTNRLVCVRGLPQAQPLTATHPSRRDYLLPLSLTGKRGAPSEPHRLLLLSSNRVIGEEHQLPRKKRKWIGMLQMTPIV